MDQRVRDEKPSVELNRLITWLFCLGVKNAIGIFMEQWVEILNRLLFLLHFLASAHEDTEM